MLTLIVICIYVSRYFKTSARAGSQRHGTPLRHRTPVQNLAEVSITALNQGYLGRSVLE